MKTIKNYESNEGTKFERRKLSLKTKFGWKTIENTPNKSGIKSQGRKNHWDKDCAIAR